jgi:hypothetical protein
MNELFRPVKFSVDEVVRHFSVGKVSASDRKLIHELRLPGSGALSDPDPQKAREAARTFLSSFLMAGPG